MDQIFTGQNLFFIERLGFAMLLGMAIGAERIIAHKTAGMRTYSLVAMGSALFVIISEMIIEMHPGLDNNPSQIPSLVISGVGFLGTGLMIWKDSKLFGLTTATSIWVAAGIGIACGFGFFELAVLATILTLFIFVVLWFLENRLRHSSLVQHSDPEDFNN